MSSLRGITVHCGNCNNVQMECDFRTDTYICPTCGTGFTREYIEDRMALVRGQFQTLFAPGIQVAWQKQVYKTVTGTTREETTAEWVEEQERMAIIHPDTHKIPIWRRPPKRTEGPVTAYRVWELARTAEGPMLESVAANVKWPGPVLRSDARPIDPALWDKDKGAVHHVFNLAGIWTVKTFGMALHVRQVYGVVVVGEVKLWGRIAQFTYGYRSEYCMISKLWLTPGCGAYKPALEQRYGCDVLDLPTDVKPERWNA